MTEHLSNSGHNERYPKTSEVLDLTSKLASAEEEIRSLRIKAEGAEDLSLTAHRWFVQAQQLQDQVSNLRQSTSWRITAPLRLASLYTGKGIRFSHRIRKRLLKQLSRSRSATPTTSLNASVPITLDIVGHINGSYSLAEVNRAFVRALTKKSKANVRLTVWEGDARAEVEAVEIGDRPILEAATASPPSGKHVAVVQHYPILELDDRYDLKVLLQFWEESLMPREMVDQINSKYDAVFAPTSSVQKALIDSGISLPVRTVQYPGTFSKFRSVARDRSSAAAAGVKSEVVFLHVSSCFPRKGVDALIHAYKEAFTEDQPVRLIIKGFPNPHNNVGALLEISKRTKTGGAPITFINEDMSEEDVLALYRQADVVVLPTHGEGLNLPAAEALASGLRLIVTGFGGHTDFLDSKSARLIDFGFAKSQSHLSSLNSVWVEPNRADLKSALLQIFNEVKTERASRTSTDRWPAVSDWFDEEKFARRLENVSLALLSTKPIAPRIAWVSTYNVKCGIAEYSRHLIAGLPNVVSVLCDDRVQDTPLKDDYQVEQAWSIGETSAERLIKGITGSAANTVVVQYHPGFMPLSTIETLFSDPAISNIRKLIALHNVKDIISSSADLSTTYRALRLADRVLVHTIYDLNLLKGIGLVENVTLFPQGAPSLSPNVRSDDREVPLQSPIVGGYGFLFPHKGIRSLIEALPLVQEQWASAKLRLVTSEYPDYRSANELKYCRALADKLGVASSIEWHTDFLSHEESLHLLSSCDVVTLPYKTTSEASSAAARTVLASGRPTAVTPIRIFEDLGDAVFRFRSDENEDIAAGIIRLLESPTQRQKLRENAAHWISEHEWSVLAKRFSGMVAGLLNT